MIDPDSLAPGARRRRNPVDVTAEQTSVSLDGISFAPPSSIVEGTKDGGDEGTVVQSVLRAIDIVEILANATAPLRLQEVARAAGLNSSTCHHLLNSLVQRDFAVRHAQPRAYGLGPRLAQLARQSRNRFDIAQSAHGHMIALRQKTGASVCLAALDETTLELLSEHSHPSSPPLDRWREGLARASHATAVGKAILAWLPETQIARVVAINDLTPFTEYTIRTLGELVENLRQIRRHGFSIEDREFQEDIVGIACALRDPSGGVVGAIGCILPAEDASSERLQSVRGALAMAAAAIAPSIP